MEGRTVIGANEDRTQHRSGSSKELEEELQLPVFPPPGIKRTEEHR